jgi:hypothetical protein
MGKKIRIQILALILLLLCFYFFVFSIRSPVKDLTYPLIYRQTFNEILAELDRKDFAEHKINAYEIALKRLLPELNIYRRFGMTVFTNTSVYNVKNTIHLIQTHFSTLERAYPDIARSKDIVFNIVILETIQDYNQLTARIAPHLSNTVGFYHDDLKTLFICHNPKKNAHASIPQNTIRHEATHQWFFAQGLHHGFTLDRLWLVEGLATYYEQAQIGSINPFRQKAISQHIKSDTLLPLAQVMKENGTFDFKDEEYTHLYYDQSWALVYFLMKNHREAFKAYLLYVQRHPLQSFLKGDLQVISQTLDTSPEEFEKAFLNFWKRY